MIGGYRDDVVVVGGWVYGAAVRVRACRLT